MCEVSTSKRLQYRRRVLDITEEAKQNTIDDMCGNNKQPWSLYIKHAPELRGCVCMLSYATCVCSNTRVRVPFFSQRLGGIDNVRYFQLPMHTIDRCCNTSN